MRIAKKFFMSALLLTFSALIMRSISLSFGAYVSRTAGTEAMGVFSLIMSVFSFALTLATSGVNLAVTRMVSEALGNGNHGLARKNMRVCLAYCLFFGSLSGILMFILASPIGFGILKDGRTVFSMKILAVSLPFISVSSALGGYFTAVRRVYKSTFFGVLEQFVKIFFTVKLFEILIGRGIEYACIALVTADAISEVTAAAVSGLLYLRDRKKYIKKESCAASTGAVLKNLCSVSLPVAFSTYIRSGLLTIEHILIPKSLIKNGLARSEALSLYGMLHSMVMPVVLFPTAILLSFSGLLIPELAEAKIKSKKALIGFIASRAFHFSLVFSFCISGILITFSDELGCLIYQSHEVGNFIRMIAPLVPVMYLDGVTDSMLKGLGEQVYSMNVNIIDALLSVICVILLLPKFGIVGYVITIYLTEIINASLSIIKLLSITGMHTNIKKWVFAPLLSVIGASSLCRIFIGTVPLPVSGIEEVVICSLSVIFLYFILARLTGGINKSDIKYLRGVFRRSP